MMSASSIKKGLNEAYELKIIGVIFSSIKKAALSTGTLIKVDNLFPIF